MSKVPNCESGGAFYLISYVSVQHSKIPPNLEVTDEVLERTAGTDISDV